MPADGVLELHALADRDLQSVAGLDLSCRSLFYEFFFSFVCRLDICAFVQRHCRCRDIPGAKLDHAPGYGLIHVITVLHAGKTRFHTELQRLIIHQMRAGRCGKSASDCDDSFDLFLGKLDLCRGTDA